jgi:NAD-dependent dihydropyrimidine dehydrogenase PreA subunit
MSTKLEIKMGENVFRALQKRLDTYSLGFPATTSGVELTILKKLFSAEDAAMFLNLTPKLEAPESVAQRLKRPVSEVAAQLEDMSKRKLLFRLQKKGSVAYAAIPFVHGLFEFQINDLDREMAELVEQYQQEGFDQSLIQGASAFLRTVPVQRSIDVAHNVAAYEDACAILRNKESIVVAECICRKQKRLIDKACDKPMEACFMFGSMGQYYLDHGMGRRIDAAEAIRILTEAQAAGLVTQPATAQNPGGMCNCCGDCCGVLSTLNQHPRPAEMVFSNHYALVDSDLCTGCETCLERCQMGALTINDEELAEVNSDRCIGCGLCVTTCPTEALRLIPKTEDEQRIPPVTTAEQMKSMAQKRGF